MKSTSLTDYLTYPIKIWKDAKSHGYNVEIPCLPRAHTCGDNYDEAMDMAKALVTDIASFDAGEREIMPGAAPKDGEPFVRISEDDALKILLRNAMFEAKISMADLARLTHRKDAAVRRSLSFGRATKLSTLASYFQAIGRPFTLTC